MAQPELVEDFFGVYLLYCENPKYKGRCYIGYTRDPKRRITQHNKGSWAGGAHRTSNRGPWKMVLIVHGFPNNISALRFEWAWQNPAKTKRLQHLNLRKIPRKETVFKFNLRVLSEMLRVGPWCRLPLLIRWLEKDFEEEFPVDKKPPSHMPICHGPVKSRNLKINAISNTPANTECLLCSRNITNHLKMSCLNSTCELVCHITCLAELMLTPGEYVPIEGDCPFCGHTLKWGDLIRKMKGCKMDDNGKNDVGGDVGEEDVGLSDGDAGLSDGDAGLSDGDGGGLSDGDVGLVGDDENDDDDKRDGKIVCMEAVQEKKKSPAKVRELPYWFYD